VLDVEVAGLLRRGIRDVFEGVPGDDSELDLELVDIAIERYMFNIPLSPPALWMLGADWVYGVAREILLYSSRTRVQRTMHPLPWILVLTRVGYTLSCDFHTSPMCSKWMESGACHTRV
jgi:hypothetical protein